MPAPTSRRSPGRDRLGLRVIEDLNAAPAPVRRCDDATLVCHATIYAFPIWEISHKTGLIRLYEADPATGQLVQGRNGKPILVTEVPSVEMSTRTAKPRIVWGYVGQTIRPLEIREGEHVDEKCWADVIAGRPIVVAEGDWNKKTRDDAEIAAIADLKPRFNKEYNEHNEHRIPIWRQVELRHARDDALKRPRWLPLEQRTALAVRTAELQVVGAGLDGREPRYLMTVVGETLTDAGRWVWARPRVRAALLVTALWSAGVLGGVAALSRYGWTGPYAWTVAVLVFTVLTAAVFGGRRKKRRRRRR